MIRRPIRCLLVVPLLAGLMAWPVAASDPPGSGVVTDAESIALLIDEVQRLRRESEALRRQLADVQLREREKDRQLAELRQFIEDHHEFGPDFARYRAVRETTERDARRKALEVQRRRRDAQRAERQARQEEARRDRERARAEDEWEERYRRAGFASIGLEVYGGRMAYAYQTRETDPVRIDYDPFIGLYYRPGGPTTEIDFSAMTISGSVLNAADAVRNIGVAITFFDEEGNQVGGEIMRINNARPDVPYPFTSTVQMALDRPFSSSSAYVLYADPIAP